MTICRSWRTAAAGSAGGWDDTTYSDHRHRADLVAANDQAEAEEEPMSTLRDKLADRIAFEQNEITRVQTESADRIAKAEANLATLLQADAVLAANPSIDALVAALHSMGIEI